MTPVVNEASITLLDNQARSENNTFSTFILHCISPVGISHSIISPAPAEKKNKICKQDKSGSDFFFQNK